MKEGCSHKDSEQLILSACSSISSLLKLHLFTIEVVMNVFTHNIDETLSMEKETLSVLGCP